MNRLILSMVAPVLLSAAPKAVVAQALPEAIVPLPAPTGPSPVGTVVAYLTDSSRRDSEFAQGRPITVQLWYPATASGGARAPYLVENGFGAMLVSTDYYGIDTTALKKWPAVRTHSRLDAPVVRRTYPLITFSVGAGVARANYTSLAEELASHGYVVALVESPLAGMKMLPSGRVITDTAGRFQTPAMHRTGVAHWSHDISFALDKLHSPDLPRDVKRVAATIDWTRIGAAGHSSGGLVAIATCENDPRVRACVNLDGGMASPEQEPMADFVAKGTTKPTLLLRSKPLYSEADFARRGLTREQWEKRGEGGRIALDSVLARARGPLWMGFVAGTGHMSFSDAPFVMPSAISRFGGKIIDAQRGLLVITTTMRAFFDQELGSMQRKSRSLATLGTTDKLGTTSSDALPKLSARFPEVTVTRIKP